MQNMFPCNLCTTYLMKIVHKIGNLKTNGQVAAQSRQIQFTGKQTAQKP